MTGEPALIGWHFWFRWVFLTVVGYTVGWTLGFVFGHFLLGNVMLGIGTGAGVGYMQWRVLRSSVQQSGGWVLASIAGLTVCLGLYWVVASVWGYPFNLGWPAGVLGWALAFAVGGTLIGVLQRRVLRPHVGRSAWWVPASAVGWGLSVIGVAIPPDMASRAPFLVILTRNMVVPSAVAGALLGTVTGGALIWLLRQPTPGEAD